MPKYLATVEYMPPTSDKFYTIDDVFGAIQITVGPENVRKILVWHSSFVVECSEEIAAQIQPGKIEGLQAFAPYTRADSL